MVPIFMLLIRSNGISNIPLYLWISHLYLIKISQEKSHEWCGLISQYKPHKWYLFILWNIPLEFPIGYWLLYPISNEWFIHLYPIHGFFMDNQWVPKGYGIQQPISNGISYMDFFMDNPNKWYIPFMSQWIPINQNIIPINPILHVIHWMLWINP